MILDNNRASVLFDVSIILMSSQKQKNKEKKTEAHIE
jgi:hypothetical protein